MLYKSKTVGEIVAQNFATARVFRKYGIDFCCHGDINFEDACAAVGASEDDVIGELEKVLMQVTASNDFIHWPYDLLIDYVLKIHHRGIRKVGPDMLDLFDKVIHRHGTDHPELSVVRGMFESSLEDLDVHLSKEENVLFPYLYSLFEADENGQSIDAIHCGSVSHPISVMMSDHAGEGERYKEISRLTNSYQVPADACNSYRLLLSQLHQFEMNLNEHIHIENNIIFPAAIRIEDKMQNNCQILK